MTGPTPQDEIDRQHAQANKLVEQSQPTPAIRVSDGKEIALRYKTRPVDDLLARGSATLTESATNPQDDDDREDWVVVDEHFPTWNTRGFVDVTALQDLVREGYNQTVPVIPTSVTKSTTTTATESTTTASPNPSTSGSQKRKTFQASDVKSITNLWSEPNAAVHNVAICRPSHDAWGINKIVLVFCDDFLRDIYELPWWHGRDDMRLAVQPILDVLRIPPQRIVRMLLASLPPGVTIPVHHDTGEWVRHTHRVHVPVLVQNPDRVVFQCGVALDSLQRIPCAPGHVFEINNQAKHAVSNCDTDHRVHLILDYVDADFPLLPRILLRPGEKLLQTRRSIDRLENRGSRPTPSFLILGAQKAGTTSLYEYIVQHPLVVPARRRETHCLDWRWNDKLKSVKAQRAWCHKFYLTQELSLHPSCLTGDSTPSYLLDSRRVIPRIRNIFDWPLKFFVMLRNPIRRAESHFAMVTSSEGTPAQLKARGSEWRNKTFREVVHDDMRTMQTHGLIPYWNVDDGVLDIACFDTFVGSPEEDAAYDRYLAQVPLHTGSHSLISRGLYELQLRPWFVAFDPAAFLVMKLEHFRERGVTTAMEAVWKHLDLPCVSIQNEEAKNVRSYDPIADDSMQVYLERFYAPHNERLVSLLGDDAWNQAWCP